MLVESVKPGQFHKQELILYKRTILLNPLIKFKPYPKQVIPVLLANRPEQLVDGERKPNQVLVGAGGYGGKGLSLETVIPTNDGFKLMKDIRVGDLLFTETGDLTPVIAVSEIHNGLDCFKFIFDDDTEVVCDEQHLWFTSTYQSRRSHKRSRNPQINDTVKTVPEIINTLRHPKTRNNHAVKNTEPLQYTYKKISIPPYTLGAWLGDGTSISGGFTTNDYEIIEQIQEDGFEVTKHKYKYGYGILGLKLKLREYGLLGNKHVPDDYLFNDYDTRLSVVQGLMDTDGNINPDGQCEFTQKNYNIIYGLKLLLNSLGIKTRIRSKTSKCNGKDCGLVYVLKFKTTLPVFRLKRKLERLPTKVYQSHSRHIKEIIPVKSVPTKCIMVANPTSLYLCTESCIPTHNTFLGSMLAAQHLLTESDYTCLVTRLNYAELLDTNSIWENLVDWCCNEELHQDVRCNYKKSPAPQIEAPNGNIIYFKAFDNEKKKQKFKSTSYDRIVNDEASELPTGVLRFQFRSSRNTSNIPRSIINLSNPGGDSTDYLVEKFVDGPQPYVPLDWRDNPFIDKAAYKGSLNELDYVDRQYQMYGNWHYKPSVGDLINREDMVNQLLGVPVKRNDVRFSLIGIDLAGKGKDKFAVCRYDLLMNGLECVMDFNQTESSMPEDMLLNFISKHNPDKTYPLTSLIVIEQEGGGSPLYAQRYFQELITSQGYNIPVILKTPKGSKYQRARPLMRMIRNGQVKLFKECNCLEDFIDESISLMPVMKRSPNLVDSASLSHNYLHDTVLNAGATMKLGGRIGGH